MTRKKTPVPTTPAGWTVSTTITVNGRIVEPGTELSIRGERGRFRFVRHVATSTGAVWIDVVGGQAKHEMSRAFRVERVRTVHRIARTRANA